MGQHLVHETSVAVAKVAPALGGVAWYTHTLQEWVAIVTICYVVLQIGLLLPRYVNMYLKWKNK